MKKAFAIKSRGLQRLSVRDFKQLTGAKQVWP
jgi:hypothetical protein